MPNLAVQVANLNTAYFQSLKKYEKPKESYLTFFHSKNRKKDRHKLSRKTRYWINFLKQRNYLLTSLDKIFKNSLSGGRENPYIALEIDNKNLFFLKNTPTETYYLEKQKDYLFSHLIWREKEELENLLEKRPRQFRKKWKEIELKTEILSKWDNPAKLVAGYKENGRPKPSWEGVGWNSLDYWEPKNRSLAALAFSHEIVLGKVDAPLLDLDPNKKDKEGNYKIKQEWLRKALVIGGKKWKALINKYQIPYYWTTGTPGNCLVPIPYWLIGEMKGGNYCVDCQQKRSCGVLDEEKNYCCVCYRKILEELEWDKLLVSSAQKLLNDYRQRVIICQCLGSEKPRVSYVSSDGSGWSECERCEKIVSSAGHHRVVKNRNDPKFWGLEVEERVLCGGCLRGLVEEMPRRKKYLFREYGRRGYV